MAAPLSRDLRERIVGAVADGSSIQTSGRRKIVTSYCRILVTGGVRRQRLGLLG
jgi:hypothetical protein